MSGRNRFKLETQIFPEETKLKNDTPLSSVLASVQGANESTWCDAVLEQGAILEWEGAGLSSLIPTLSFVLASDKKKKTVDISACLTPK